MSLLFVCPKLPEDRATKLSGAVILVSVSLLYVCLKLQVRQVEDKVVWCRHPSQCVTALCLS